MADFVMAAGDLEPAIVSQLGDTRPTPWDLNSIAGVAFRMRRPGSPTNLIDAACDVLDPTQRVVSYAWQTADATLPAGYYLGRFRVDFGSGRTEQFPGSLPLAILLDGIPTPPVDGTAGPLGAATIEHVAVAAGRELTAPEVIFLEVNLPIIAGQLNTWLGRSIGLATVTDEQHFVDWTDAFIPLYRTPVASIASITVDGITVDPVAWKIERSGVTLYISNSTGSITPPSDVRITYTGGRRDQPAIVAARGTIISRALRLMQKWVEDQAAGVTSLRVADYAVAYADEGFTDSERAAVRRYKRRYVSGNPTAPYGSLGTLVP